jgi:phosphoribosylanthranilate isomerase
MSNIEVWPVIHHIHIDSSVKDAEIAYNNGATGVFLISMIGKDSELRRVGLKIKKQFPKLLVGINYLSMYNHHAIKANVADGFDATWVDFADITGNEIKSTAINIANFLRSKESNCHKYFAGIAFKYQGEEPNPDQAAINAEFLNFIPTTSGPGTGKAASIDKIKLMSKNLCKLAIASGITPENVEEYAPYISHVLVNTGIANSDQSINENKLKKLMEAI